MVLFFCFAVKRCINFYHLTIQCVRYIHNVTQPTILLSISSFSESQTETAPICDKCVFGLPLVSGAELLRSTKFLSDERSKDVSPYVNEVSFGRYMGWRIGHQEN